jgi:hypothetical protein
MGARTIAAYNPTLTHYAQGLAQDLSSAIADFVAPLVEVPAGLGRYKQFDEKNAFQIYNTERALGGPATRIQFAATDPAFDCRPQALEAGIDDAEYDAAGEDNSQRLDESRVRTLLSSATLAHEDKVIQAAKTVAAVGGKGVWSNASIDPIAEIDEQIEALATACGMMPNRIVFGLGAWRVARNHQRLQFRRRQHLAAPDEHHRVALGQFAVLVGRRAVAHQHIGPRFQLVAQREQPCPWGHRPRPLIHHNLRHALSLPRAGALHRPARCAIVNRRGRPATDNKNTSFKGDRHHGTACFDGGAPCGCAGRCLHRPGRRRRQGDGRV